MKLWFLVSVLDPEGKKQQGRVSIQRGPKKAVMGEWRRKSRKKQKLFLLSMCMEIPAMSQRSRG